MSKKPSGNEHGNENKRIVAGHLAAHGFYPVRYDRESSRNPVEEIRQFALCDMVVMDDVRLCKSVIGTDFEVDFLLWKQGWPTPIAILCFHQQSSGSTYMKLEHFYATVKERCPCPAMFILEGPEFREGVRLRANEQVAMSGGRILRIFDSNEELVHRWLMQGAPYPQPEQRLI